MNLSEVFLILSILISFIGYFFYSIFSFKRREINPAPWIIWSLVGMDAWYNVLSGESTFMEKFLNGVYFLGPFFITILLVLKGKWSKVGRREYIDGFFSLILLFVIVGLRNGELLREDYKDFLLTSGVLILEASLFYQLLRSMDYGLEDKKPWISWILSCGIGLLALKLDQGWTYQGSGLTWMNLGFSLWIVYKIKKAG